MGTSQYKKVSFFKGHIISPERIAMCLIGILFVALSIALIRFAGFGNDPYSSLMVGVWNLAKKIKPDIPLGTIFLIINMSVAITVFFVHRSFIGIGTLINMFLMGYISDYFFGLIANLFIEPQIGLRIVILAVGIILEAFGTAFCLEADQGVSPYDGISLMIFKYHPKWKFRWIRVCCDVGYVVLAVIFFAISTIIGQNAFDPAQWTQLGSVVGIGSVVIALCLGPILIFLRTHIAAPIAMYRYKKTAEEKNNSDHSQTAEKKTD